MFKTVNFLSGLYLIDKFAHCSGVSTSIAIKKKNFTVFVNPNSPKTDQWYQTRRERSKRNIKVQEAELLLQFAPRIPEAL